MLAAQVLGGAAVKEAVNIPDDAAGSNEPEFTVEEAARSASLVGRAAHAAAAVVNLTIGQARRTALGDKVAAVVNPKGGQARRTALGDEVAAGEESTALRRERDALLTGYAAHAAADVVNPTCGQARRTEREAEVAGGVVTPAVEAVVSQAEAILVENRARHLAHAAAAVVNPTVGQARWIALEHKVAALLNPTGGQARQTALEHVVAAAVKTPAAETEENPTPLAVDQTRQTAVEHEAAAGGGGKRAGPRPQGVVPFPTTQTTPSNTTAQHSSLPETEEEGWVVEVETEDDALLLRLDVAAARVAKLERALEEAMARETALERQNQELLASAAARVTILEEAQEAGAAREVALRVQNQALADSTPVRVDTLERALEEATASEGALRVQNQALAESTPAAEDMAAEAMAAEEMAVEEMAAVVKDAAGKEVGVAAAMEVAWW